MKIIKVAGQEETRRHLESLGFVEGAAVTVINSLGGSLIINIKNSRIAISKGAANKIMV
ncbi:MAG: ferrous iron transport protein A [Eubacterium sp.]